MEAIIIPVTPENYLEAGGTMAGEEISRLLEAAKTCHLQAFCFNEVKPDKVNIGYIRGENETPDFIPFDLQSDWMAQMCMMISYIIDQNRQIQKYRRREKLDQQGAANEMAALKCQIDALDERVRELEEANPDSPAGQRSRKELRMLVDSTVYDLTPRVEAIKGEVSRCHDTPGMIQYRRWVHLRKETLPSQFDHFRRGLGNFVFALPEQMDLLLALIEADEKIFPQAQERLKKCSKRAASASESTTVSESDASASEDSTANNNTGNSDIETGSPDENSRT